MDYGEHELIRHLEQRGLPLRLSVRASAPKFRTATLVWEVAELMGMGTDRARAALDGHQIVLHSVSPAQANAAATRIERAGGLVQIELGLVERYAFVPDHPLRGLQVCERLSILDGDLILTRGQLAKPPELRTLLHDASVSELFGGFDRERARWASAGMVEVDDESELLQRVSAREPQLEAELCAAHDHFFPCAEVYGDWLLSQGDPRGLIAAPSLLIRTTTDQAIREQASAELERIIDEHASHLLGSLHLQLQPDALRWLGPVIIGATLEPEPAEEPPDEGPLIWCGPMVPLGTLRPECLHAEELLRLAKLLALPAAITLRWLELEGPYVNHPQLLHTLAKARCASSLRALTLDEPANLRVSGGPFEQLQKLTLINCEDELTLTIALPALRRLSVDFMSSPPGLLACFTGLHAPALEHFELSLEVLPEWADEHGPLLEQLQALLALPSFARLQSLTLGTRGYAPYDGIDRVLATIPAAATLQRVDLRDAEFDELTRARLQSGALAVPELLL